LENHDLRRLSSSRPHRAPWLIDGPINGEGFRTYVEKMLAPTLKPGDLVIMDNLGSHKGKAVRQAIRSAGAKLFFLPKYSPDLNPIEQVFAKLKHLLRKAAARTLDTVVAAIRELLDAYTAPKCANYFANAGYSLKTSRSRCLVPSFDGVFLSSDSKDALWDRFYTGAPRRQRRSVERYSIVKRA
jgi:transposase